MNFSKQSLCVRPRPGEDDEAELWESPAIIGIDETKREIHSIVFSFPLFIYFSFLHTFAFIGSIMEMPASGVVQRAAPQKLHLEEWQSNLAPGLVFCGS